MSKVRITIDGTVEDYEALSSFAKRAGTFVEEHEPGTLAWECFADEVSGRVLWHEIYTDADAFLAHMQHMTEEGYLDEFMQLMSINGVLSLARVTDDRVTDVLAGFGATHLHGVTGVVR